MESIELTELSNTPLNISRAKNMDKSHYYGARSNDTKSLVVIRNDAKVTIRNTWKIMCHTTFTYSRLAPTYFL